MSSIPLFGKTEPISAGRIWCRDAAREQDQYVRFRKRFTVPSGGRMTVKLFADTCYNLYVDGVLLHRGPVRRHEQNAFFDELKLELSAERTAFSCWRATLARPAPSTARARRCSG